ncbi:ATPase [Bacillus sp. CGMCC 1.16541]|uniref:ATPase n=1 Tax=Bacillus sp. CGMCC 1.16541 TaxID=2185143 RepID=UPI000D73A283|nr:ATPase [Bacillus sp. CGMCC 1.16541]
MSKRDVLFAPLSDNDELVFAVDNIGAIGEKETDTIQVTYEMVAYYSLRVAMMEVLSVGGVPICVVVANFNDSNAWVQYETALHQIREELHLGSIQLIGSSETNFHLVQSAASFTVVGTVKKATKRIGQTPMEAKLAVIGYPLVGQDVILRQHDIISLQQFNELLHYEGVYEILPIGSKGIQHELNVLHDLNEREKQVYSSSLPLHQSAGPATCVLISYHETCEQALSDSFQNRFYPLRSNGN